MDMIGELVEELGVSQRTLAGLMGVSHTHLSKYENHTCNMPFAAIPQVALPC